VLHTARWKYRTQKIAKNSPSWYHRASFSGYIFTTKAHIDNQKKIAKQQYLLQLSRNMVNFGPLAAEIGSVVWGTPANFNGFRVLAALLHGTPVVGVSHTCGVAQRRHLYSAGRPSRWAHILVITALKVQVYHCSHIHYKVIRCLK